MPYLNGNYWCSGIAGSGAFVGTVNPFNGIALVGGDATWLDENRIIYQTWPPARVQSFDIRNAAVQDIDPHGISVITAANGHWAIMTAQGVFDSFKRHYPESYPGPMAKDGSYCIKRLYHSYGPWDILFPDNSRILMTEGDASQIQNYGNNRASWVIDGKAYSLNIPTPNPLFASFWWLKLIEIEGVWWQLYQCEKGLIFHPINDNLGHIAAPAGADTFNPDVNYINGVATIIWANKAGGMLDDIRFWQGNPHQNRIPLTSPVPVPVPVPVPGVKKMIRAFERPMWQAPYYSFHERYGDTPISDYLNYGNAITVIGDERDPTARDRELARVYQYGVPLIVDAGESQPPEGYANLIIAWGCSGVNIHSLIESVNRILGYYEKPVIAYLDNDDWPSTNPFSSDRVWPSIQAYRFENESVFVFRERVTRVIERVSSYGLPMVLTTRFDDFNGSQPVSRIIDCMFYYEVWLRTFYFVGHMPFADRRGKGISHYPELLEHATAFNYAIPFGRPNRFDYWRPSGLTNKHILDNKFGQSRSSIVIEPYLREDIIRRYLQ